MTWISMIFDLLIIGAGLSGIGSAIHFKTKYPNKTFTILEKRSAIGGTWDVFKYPGVRSDSDMFTLGYSFKPWTGNLFATGQEINSYINEAASEHDITSNINFDTSVKTVEWNNNTWTVTTSNGTFIAKFILFATGYINHELAYQPKFNNSSDFSGKIIHAQYWDSAIIHQNKSVVVIGSGATAYTLVPELAKQAKHVTMIQRSPTYVRSESDNPQWLQQIRSNYDSELTIHLAARNESITRQKNQYHICRERPVPMRRILINDVKKELAEDIDIKHFTPTYMPWDQRICTIVNNDFIKCVNTGKVTIETDTIESFTKTGIVLASGTEVQADIVIMATGFETRIIGDVVVRINNNTIDISQLKAYKGSMIEGLPNFGYVFGYASMSWTLKLELTLEYFSKVFDFMTEHNHTACVPIDDCRIQGDSGFIGLSSSFYLRNEAKFPRQGASKPWVNTNNFDDDRTMLLEEPVNDGILKFI